MTDDHPDFNLVEIATGDCLPALPGDPTRERFQNPANAYLMSLAKQSRVTMRSYLSILARKLASTSIDACPWQHLTRQHVLALIESLQLDGLAPNTINTYLAAIKGVALEARSLRLMDTDTFLDIRNMKRVRGYRLPKGRALDAEEIQRLLFACENDNSIRGARDLAMLKILLGCGLRRDELVLIDYPEHIDWKRGTLRILGKGNKERLAYMPNATISALRHWVDVVRGSEPGPLFTRIRRHGVLSGAARLSNQSVYYVLDQRRKEAELEPVSPHDLRRTFATSMLDNAIDILTVQRMMGHASVETTKQYDRRGENAIRQATEQFALF